MIFVFPAGCGAILLFKGVARGWRTAAELENLELGLDGEGLADFESIFDQSEFGLDEAPRAGGGRARARDDAARRRRPPA